MKTKIHLITERKELNVAAISAFAADLNRVYDKKQVITERKELNVAAISAFAADLNRVYDK
jgi:hypothetical protein